MGRTVSDGLDNLRQDFEAADGAVDLAAGVVRDDDALAADLVCLERVRRALDAFDNEWATARDALPLQRPTKS